MWAVEFSADAIQDFDLIFDHLLEAYVAFGDPEDVAFDRAVARLDAIQVAALRLADAPHQGTLRPDLAPQVRFVRKDRTVFWFVADDARHTVSILAVFFGGQDHIRQMLLRLLSPS